MGEKKKKTIEIELARKKTEEEEKKKIADLSRKKDEVEHQKRNVAIEELPTKQMKEEKIQSAQMVGEKDIKKRSGEEERNKTKTKSDVELTKTKTMQGKDKVIPAENDSGEVEITT